MTSAWLNLAVGLALLVSALGVMVPVLPGTLVGLVALLAWAALTGGVAAWSAFAVSAVLIGVGQLLKYWLAQRSLAAAGVAGRSIIVAGLSAIAGFFLIPLVGLLVGFVVGLYVAELVRLRDAGAARGSTWVAMRATGFAMLIELIALCAAASVWIAAVVTLA